MKYLVLLLILVAVYGTHAQTRFSRSLDPFGGIHEFLTDLRLQGDTLLVRGAALCTGLDKFCTVSGTYNTANDSFTRLVLQEDIQIGPDLLLAPQGYLLPSEERLQGKNISLSTLDTNLHHLNTTNLRIADDHFHSYTIKSSIEFNNRYVVGAQALDNQDQITVSGNTVDKEKAILFVLNPDLTTDTVLLLAPGPGLTLKIEDMAVGADTVLYISFYNRYQAGPNAFPQRKIIRGYDQNFNQVFNWVGPDFELNESQTSLAVDPPGVLYLSYYHDFRTQIYAFTGQDTIQWVCSLDNFNGQGAVNITDLFIAQNGDLIGAGIATAAISDIGQTGYIVRINASGKIKWSRVVRINKGLDPVLSAYGFRAWLHSILELPQGDLMAAGQIFSWQHTPNTGGAYNQDIWLLRIDSMGCLWDDCPFIQDVITRQQWLPLVSAENEWVVDYHLPASAVEIRRYRFSPDSILLAGRFYRELIFSKNMTGGPWQQTGRYFREKSGAVYNLEPLTGPAERLLYDFNLGTGDNLPPNPDIGQAGRKIAAVGTTVLADGIARKTLWLTGDVCIGDSLQWIEGMGDNGMLFETALFCASPSEEHIAIRCFSTAGNLVYLRPGLAGCYSSTVAGQPPVEALHVYPNPATGTLFIHLEQPGHIRSVRLGSFLGEPAVEFDWTETQHGIRLNINALPPGWYAGSIQLQDGRTQSFKFAKI
ncbi:MAG: T9SS type A sorting domain-containing protein [Lewinellaceae bacterium]|nr:T9SS type A sorting domain-containing protein [Lewinellaceae bacterium]